MYVDQYHDSHYTHSQAVPQITELIVIKVSKNKKQCQGPIIQVIILKAPLNKPIPFHFSTEEAIQIIYSPLVNH